MASLQWQACLLMRAARLGVTATEGDAELTKMDWRAPDDGADCVHVFTVHHEVRR